MTDEELIRLIDGLEDKAENYLTLEDIQNAAGAGVLPAIAAGIVLVDNRTRLDGTPVTVCRLNRHHPLVIELTAW
jgi:hypothetical protein